MEELFLITAEEYLRRNSIDWIEEYFASEVSSINIEALKELMPELLLSLQDFLMSSKFVSESIQEKLSTLSGDALIQELLYIWTHGAIPCTIRWMRNPNEFYRKIFVPLRFNLSDIMYAGLSTMRSGLTESVYIESGEFSFLSRGEFKEEDDLSSLASDYASYAIYSLENPKMTYGYEDAWVFQIVPTYLRLLDDTQAKKPFLLMDAKGYGIFEGNQENVVALLGTSLAKTKDGILIRDLLGVDFHKTAQKELTELLAENFYMTQYRYEAYGIEASYPEENE